MSTPNNCCVAIPQLPFAATVSDGYFLGWTGRPDAQSRNKYVRVYRAVVKLTSILSIHTVHDDTGNSISTSACHFWNFSKPYFRKPREKYIYLSLRSWAVGGSKQSFVYISFSQPRLRFYWEDQYFFGDDTRYYEMLLVKEQFPAKALILISHQNILLVRKAKKPSSFPPHHHLWRFVLDIGLMNIPKNSSDWDEFDLDPGSLYISMNSGSRHRSPRTLGGKTWLFFLFPCFLFWGGVGVYNAVGCCLSSLQTDRHGEVWVRIPEGKEETHGSSHSSFGVEKMGSVCLGRKGHWNERIRGGSESGRSSIGQWCGEMLT